MNMLQLEYFMTVIEEGGLLKAAEKINISPSALSQTIKKLESELDVKLFDRSKQSLLLTYAGRKFCEYARQVLVQRNRFIQEMHDNIDDIRGELTLFLSEYKASIFLPILVPPFLQKYPHASLQIVDRHLTPELRRKNLLNGVYDFTLSPHTINDSSLQHTVICQEKLCIIIAKNSDIAKRVFPDGVIPESVSLECFTHEHFILAKHGYSSRTCAEHIFQDQKFHPNILLELNSSIAIHELASTGLACAILHRYIDDTHPHSPSVYEIPIEHHAAVRDVYLSYNKNTYMSALHHAFIHSVLTTLNHTSAE